MPFLVITGTSQWGCAAPGSGIQWFPPGVHEVSPEVALIARAEAPERVHISDVRPELAAPGYGGVLTLEDIRYGTGRTRPADTPGDDEEEDDYEPQYEPGDYPCPYCDRVARSEEELRWHEDFKHSIHHAEPEPVPEPDDAPEPQDEELVARLDSANPSELPPWARPGV
jgi:hypothetical protein